MVVGPGRLHHECPALDRQHAQDTLPITNGHAALLHDVGPEGKEALLPGFAPTHSAVERQLDRARHRDLAARIVCDGATEALLLERYRAQTLLPGRETGGYAGGTAADNDDIEWQLSAPARLGDALGNRSDRLTALLDGVGDQPHAAELAGDVDTGHVALEARRDLRDLDATRGGAKDQGDRVGGTRGLAGTMTDARRGLDQLGLAVEQADNLAFGTRADAGAATDTAGRVDQGVERRRLVEPSFLGLLLGVPAASLLAERPAHIGAPGDDKRERVKLVAVGIVDKPDVFASQARERRQEPGAGSGERRQPLKHSSASFAASLCRRWLAHRPGLAERPPYCRANRGLGLDQCRP